MKGEFIAVPVCEILTEISELIKVIKVVQDRTIKSKLLKVLFNLGYLIGIPKDSLYEFLSKILHS